jgi:hypothetical protein
MEYTGMSLGEIRKWQDIVMTWPIEHLQSSIRTAEGRRDYELLMIFQGELARRETPIFATRETLLRKEPDSYWMNHNTQNQFSGMTNDELYEKMKIAPAMEEKHNQIDEIVGKLYEEYKKKIDDIHAAMMHTMEGSIQILTEDLTSTDRGARDQAVLIFRGLMHSQLGEHAKKIETFAGAKNHKRHSKRHFEDDY